MQGKVYVCKSILSLTLNSDTPKLTKQIHYFILVQGKTVRNKNCVFSLDRNGGLSLWGAWGSCSKSCGGGVQTRTRACDNPTRKGFGADCVGALSMNQACNQQLCPRKLSKL